MLMGQPTIRRWLAKDHFGCSEWENQRLQNLGDMFLVGGFPYADPSYSLNNVQNSLLVDDENQPQQDRKNEVM